eukprot:2609047-Karenia_brevis.AAC.1
MGTSKLTGLDWLAQDAGEEQRLQNEDMIVELYTKEYCIRTALKDMENMVLRRRVSNQEYPHFHIDNCKLRRCDFYGLPAYMGVILQDFWLC